MNQVTVLDYELGNLYSVRRALEHIGAQVTISSDPGVIKKSERLIIPGVGAFGEGMAHIRDKGLYEPVTDLVYQNKPVLGICLGMQLIMSMSEEFGQHQGLNYIEGDVLALEDHRIDDVHFKIPHIGWNDVNCDAEMSSWDDPLLNGLHPEDFFYFVHAFGVFPHDPQNVLTRTRYGQNTFCSIVKKGQLYGCQFHPEKSGEPGLTLLRNFMSLN